MKNRLRLWLRSERALGLAAMALRPAGGVGMERAAGTDGAETAAAGNRPAPHRQNVVQRQQEIPAPRTRRVEVSVVARGVAAPGALVPLSQTPALPTDEKRRSLARMQQEVAACIRCRLSETRTQTVFGEGDVDAEIFFIGEGPGETEDQTGRPFVGRAGELLNKMIAGMGLKREQVYIANIVKCRPPGNRAPAPDEVASCTPFLERQMEIVRPKVIVTLGLPAAKHILQTRQSMGRMRGQWHEWRGIRVMPTFHPAYLLRSYTRENREAVWSDLQQVMAEVGLPMPNRGKGQDG